MQFRIKRYNDRAKQILHAKTEVKPYLHVILKHMQQVTEDQLVWGIYVWDTRELVESGTIKKPDLSKFYEFTEKTLYKMPNAKDNGEPLKGGDRGERFYLNQALDHFHAD